MCIASVHQKVHRMIMFTMITWILAQRVLVLLLDNMSYSISIQKNRSNHRVPLVKAQKLILHQEIFSGHTQYASNINDDDNYDGGGGCEIRSS